MVCRDAKVLVCVQLTSREVLCFTGANAFPLILPYLYYDNSKSPIEGLAFRDMPSREQLSQGMGLPQQ